MRNLAKHEMDAVNGAALSIEGCIYQVSSKNIPKREFDLIETNLQKAFNGTISFGEARQILDNAGVSQRSIDIYIGNIPSKPSYCA
jgi:hypothetical protein